MLARPVYRAWSWSWVVIVRIEVIDQPSQAALGPLKRDRMSWAPRLLQMQEIRHILIWYQPLIVEGGAGRAGQ